MEASVELTIHAVPHPNPAVRRVGFDLDHPYVEQVITAVVGPTAVLLLRRLPVLWRESEPARIKVHELSRSLGLGGRAAHADRLSKAVSRLAYYDYAPRGPGTDGELAVFTQVPPLRARQLAQIPEWNRQAHERLLDEHITRHAATYQHDPPTPAAAINARHQHLQDAPSPTPPGPTR